MRRALKFNGKDQYAFAAAADLGKELSYQATVNKKKEQRTARMASPDIEQTSFLIEAYFQTAPGHTGGVLVAKMDEQAGYQLSINKAGGATLSLKAGSAAGQLPCGAKVNDGKWHHLIAEVDRPAKKGAIYVNGQLAAEGAVDLATGRSPTAGFCWWARPPTGNSSPGDGVPSYRPRHAGRCLHEHRGTLRLAVRRPVPPRLRRPGPRRQGPRRRGPSRRLETD